MFIKLISDSLLIFYHYKILGAINTNNSSKLSELVLPLNRFPITGTFPTPGVCSLLFDTFFLIPPITTISPSATNNFVQFPFY
jgi:hypothetical protein